MSNVYAVIMAGGVGSRFWPMSRKDHPKQFIDILGTGETLIQATFRRLQKICPTENMLVVTNEDYVSLVKQQLPLLSEKNLLAEPSRKNTAPCIAYAAWKIHKRNPEAVMLVAPSDHVITKEDDFYAVIGKGLNYVTQYPHLLTLGITPSRPDTGYGYIQFDTSEKLEFGVHPVKTFTEKPSADLATQFVESGEFVWNSGMFLWSAKAILQEMAIHMPEEYALFAEQESTFDTPEEKQAIAGVYAMVRNISIDYGVMEKSEHVFVLAADIGWSDLGTWGALYEELTRGKKKKEKNAVIGEQVMMYNTNHCIVHVPKDKLVVIQGLEGFIVAENNGVLLICKMEDEQKIKNLVNEVKIEKGEEYL